MPKLSIIIPVYNEAPYLRRCLDSIDKNEDVEVIVVDDGSTDGSDKILEDYAHGFTVLFQEHYGVAHTRNIGLQLATGEFVMFLDSDDQMAKDGVETLLKILQGRDDDILHLNHYRCHDGVCEIGRKFFARQGTYHLDSLPPKWAVVWNKVYKTEFLKKNEIRFNVGQQFDEDRNFNLRCFKFEPQLSVIETAVVNKYFDNKESICHTMNKEKLLGAFDALFDLLEEDNSPQLNELIRRSIIMHLESKKFEKEFIG